MSTANTFHSPLRLLERPASRVAVSRVHAEPPAPLADRWVQLVERYWAWGEGVRHHRMGSYTAH
ncbi:hypothetical protein [Ideonella sp. BN130291]|uniref:hypothetical protein n=1 Tax=Ideonella sp. BN130291 TaxID=3112940 RepID=UPI002E276158|nr:hypothetical protein [Ideonella sp. BN130291]